MREIKFRAWDDNNKYFCSRSWVEGNWYFALYSKDIVLQQFTGLLDKNGVEIYEGDIVKLHRFTLELGDNLGVTEGETKAICKISICEAGVMVDSEPFFAYSGLHEESFEVIGNIYEHNHLLDNN